MIKPTQWRKRTFTWNFLKPSFNGILTGDNIKSGPSTVGRSFLKKEKAGSKLLLTRSLCIYPAIRLPHFQISIYWLSDAYKKQVWQVRQFCWGCHFFEAYLFGYQYFKFYNCGNWIARTVSFEKFICLWMKISRLKIKHSGWVATLPVLKRGTSCVWNLPGTSKCFIASVGRCVV